ncbi:MAG: translocation and assembly module TamB [Alteromonadaceae bacterium]|jgi:translocation and assembly module TamB
MTYKRAGFGVMAIFTGVLCFFAILLSTPWGAQLSLYVVRTISPIKITYQSGALLDNLMLSQLTINNDEVVISAKKIRLQLHLRCLWKNQLCIDELSMASLQVKMKENRATSPEELIEEISIPPLFSLPFSVPFTVKMKKLLLTKVQIKNQNLEINLTNFTSALTINDVAINIAKATLATADIHLSETDLLSVPSKKSKRPIQPIQNWPLATLPKVSLPFRLTVKAFTVKKLIVKKTEQTGDENTILTIDDAVARLSWFKTQLSIEELSAKVDSMAELSLKGKFDFIPPYSVDLALISTIAHFELLPQLTDSKQKISLHGDLSGLRANISNQGELALTAELSINVIDANLPYKLSANVTEFTLPDDIAKVITPSTLLLKSQGDLTQHVIDLKSDVSGYGYHDAAIALQATYSEQVFKINTLYFKELNANNILNMTGQLTLGDRLSWDVKLDSSGITLPNILPNALSNIQPNTLSNTDKYLSGRVQGSIHSKGFWYDKEWALSFVDSAVNGEINKIKFNAAANIDINHEGSLAPSEIMLDYGDIALNLKGYSDENWHVDGLVNIGNTHLWLANIESDLRSSLSITGPVQQPEIKLQGQLKSFLMAKLSSDLISFDATYRPMNNHQHQVSFTSALMNWNEHIINKVNLASNGDLNQQQLNLAWLGDSSMDLLINSQYSSQNDQWTVQTDQASFALGEHVFKSNQPLNLLYNKRQNTLVINKHCWLGISAELCMKDNVTLTPAKGELTLAIKLGTDLLKPMIPKDIFLQSALEGDVAVGWQSHDKLSVNAKLLISEGQLQMNKEGSLQKLLEWQKGQLNLQMNNSSISGEMALFSLDNKEIINVSTALLFADNRIVDSQFTLNDFSLSPLQFLVPELTSLEGTLNTKLSVTGDLDKPILNGKITLTKGKAKVFGHINTLEDINMAIDFKGYQAAISGGININKVAATITGDVNWQDELQGDFNFDGESLNFSIPLDLTITVSPHLNAKIKAAELKISGRIEVLNGKLSVNKLPQGSVSLSKDVIIVNDKGEKVINDKTFNVLTNIRVLIADAFEVEGQGFVGRLGGELQVTQQPHQPLQLFGSLKVPEGRYRAYGQDLSMTKGNISFNGPVNNPYVSLQATRSIEKEDILVGIDASGLANSLQIKLFSKPTMQQSETLSYLVRGRGLDAKTNDSNTAIGMALGTAITNFSGVLAQIEKLPLINRIEIDGDDKQASIAGYLGDKVYIKYGVGVIEPINELTVRFYLLSRLWVEAVSSLENSANIYYSFDIK